MTFAFLVSIALRASAVLALVLLALLALGRVSAALRRLVVLLGLGVCAALPLISVAFPELPALRVAAPAGAVRIYAETLSSAETEPAPPPPVAAPVPAASKLSPPDVVGAVWLSVTLLLLVRLGSGLLRARRLVKRAVAGEAGVYSSRDVQGPLVVGLWRPCILLPVAAEEWSAERRRAVLLHELAHVRRRDGLALCLGQLSAALYWFQPLVWIALRRLRRECELAADEDVIAAGMRPSRYAEHLLAVARAMVVPSGVVAMAARPSELSRRVGVLVGRDRLPPPLSWRMTGFSSIVAALLLGFAACTEASAEIERTTANRAATNPELQSIVEDEARRARRDLEATRVAIVILDPKTGAVLGLQDDEAGRPVTPASTLKPLVVALALDAGVIQPDQLFDCGDGRRGYGERELSDAGRYGWLDAAGVLAVSSNVGMSRIFDALGGARLARGLERLRVAQIEPPRDQSIEGAVAAIGQRRVASTPLALASAYAAVANGGVLVAPGVDPERVLSESAAARLSSMLEQAVAGERATGKAARIPGIRVAGKTGTSDAEHIFASFVGFVPAERPRFVIYVGIGLAGPEGSGGTTAAPVFARLARRALAH